MKECSRLFNIKLLCNDCEKRYKDYFQLILTYFSLQEHSLSKNIVKKFRTKVHKKYVCPFQTCNSLVRPTNCDVRELKVIDLMSFTFAAFNIKCGTDLTCLFVRHLMINTFGVLYY